MPTISLRRVALVLCGLALVGCDTVPVTSGTAPAVPAAVVARSAAPDASFDGLLNAQRAAAGLAAAAPDARLTAAAERHLQDMLARDFFSHTGSDGSSAAARIAGAGFSSCRASENIALGATSAAQAMEMWMGSAGHRANILMTGSVGYGLAQGGGKWVLTVAQPC